MPKTNIIKNMEKSVAKKMVNEDDPGFKWWKDGNGLASFAHAKANPPPKGYRIAWESNGPDGEKIVRAVKGATGRRFLKFSPESSGQSRKTLNANIRNSYTKYGETATGSAYNQRGRLRDAVRTPTGVKFVGKNRGK